MTIIMERENLGIYLVITQKKVTRHIKIHFH